MGIFLHFFLLFLKASLISIFPGSGKTLVINRILEEKKDQFNTVSINCASLVEPSAVYGEIRGKLLGWPPNKRDDVITLQNAISSAAGEKKVLIVLDEIDFLSTHNKKHVLNIFRLPEVALGTCIITISNKSGQPYLQGQGLKVVPEFLFFPPYQNRGVRYILIIYSNFASELK